MKKTYNVLIIPAGSGMAIAAIQSLRKDNKIRILTVDCDRMAAGLYLGHKGFIVPKFKQTPFYSAIKKIIKREKIDVIIPALDNILLELSNRKKEFEQIGAKILISEPEAIEITRDKWKTYNKLKNKIPVPASFVEKNKVNIAFPLMIKPRDGSGSINAHKIKSQEELDFFYDRVPNPIVQEFLEGKEYTVDCLADKKGNLMICIPRERIETKAGISVKGKIVKNDKLEKIAKKISESIKFLGPFFFQAKEDKKGNPKLTEINPRISGTMSLSSSSGANIHSLAVRMYMGEKIRKPKINYGLYITRYWEDIYLTDSGFNKIEVVK